MIAVTSLDRIDEQLVALLQRNARASNKDLAAAVGLAPSSCLERVRSLGERGVISGYHAEVDLAALGRGVEAMVAVRLRPHTRPLIDRFVEHVLGLPETLEVFHVSGAEDFLLHVAVGGPHDLRDFVLDHLTARPEVGHVQTSLVFARVRKPIGA